MRPPGRSQGEYRSPLGGGCLMSFEAETDSPKYGKMVWCGLVRGDHLDATAMMLRDGKPPQENWVVAAAPR